MSESKTPTEELDAFERSVPSYARPSECWTDLMLIARRHASDLAAARAEVERLRKDAERTAKAEISIVELFSSSRFGIAYDDGTFIDFTEDKTANWHEHKDAFRARWHGGTKNAETLRHAFAAVRARAAKDQAKPTHGVDCQKALHKIAGGYLHREDDDSPYDVDGVAYCGRCHTVIS